jgi:hypothetical protein
VVDVGEDGDIERRALMRPIPRRYNPYAVFRDCHWPHCKTLLIRCESFCNGYTEKCISKQAGWDMVTWDMVNYRHIHPFLKA